MADVLTYHDLLRGVVRSEKSLLTNGSIDAALSGTVNAFDDQFADLNAWTTMNAVALPSLAANVVTAGPTNAGMVAGHSEWWDVTFRVRFNMSAGSNGYIYPRALNLVGAPYNFVRVQLTAGAVFSMYKNIENVSTQVGSSSTAAITAATWFWMEIVVSGTTYTATLYADSAGAFGSPVAGGVVTGTVADASVQIGPIGVQGAGGTGVLFGGAFADVCLVKIPAPPNHTSVVVGGVPAFCVSKTNKVSGLYALSIYGNHAASRGNWVGSPAVTLDASTTYMVSGRMRTNSAGGTGARIVFNSIVPTDGLYGYVLGTVDWQSRYGRGAGVGAADSYILELFGSGTAWGDNFWLAQGTFIPRGNFR